MIGKVLMYDNDRKFGFIKPETSGDGDVFFHVSELQKAGIADVPKQGDRLNFDIRKGDRGSRAVNISRI